MGGEFGGSISWKGSSFHGSEAVCGWVVESIWSSGDLAIDNGLFFILKKQIKKNHRWDVFAGCDKLSQDYLKNKC